MPTSYSGVPANGSQSPAIQITRPSDGDAAGVASINPALQKLADYVAWLQAHAALIDAANGFSVTQQLATGNLELTNAALQAILKATGGKLQLGTKAGNNSDLELVINGVVKTALLAAGGLDVKSQKIVNLAAPAAGSSDAATALFAEGLITALKAAANTWALRQTFSTPPTVPTPVAGTDAANKDWVEGLTAGVDVAVENVNANLTNLPAVRKVGGRAMFTDVSGTNVTGAIAAPNDNFGVGGATLLFLVPAGYRPANYVFQPIAFWDVSAAAGSRFKSGILRIGPDGNVRLHVDGNLAFASGDIIYFDAAHWAIAP